MSQSRQLAAILFTDIEGYTSMMQKSEMAAVKIRDRHRFILEQEHKSFNGTIIQFYGDGTLSIFPSAVEAVDCALTMQRIFNSEPVVPVRMGLHVGDIIVREESVFGDGVNLASRIESLGVAGSVLISDRVNDELRSHPQFKTISMGSFQFKNVDRTVEVYALDHEDLFHPAPDSLKGKTVDSGLSSVPSVPKNSIAVLPFVNMSNDPEQEYLGDGIAEEILNSLSHLKDLKVAGRTSSFQFKGKNSDLRQLGRTLGVKTVLEGSVRKQGTHLRITAQLINVEDGFHIWSEKYDRELDDIFAIQDEVALSVTTNLKITLLEAEKIIISKAPTASKEAYDLYLKGRFYWSRRGPSLKNALEFFGKALAIDPDFSLAHAALADTYALIAFYALQPPHVVIPQAKLAAERAIQLNPARVEPYSVLAYISTFYEWNWDQAKSQFEQAISMNPEYAAAHYWYSSYFCWVERDFAQAVKEAERAIELEPLNSHVHNTLSSAYTCFGRFEDARSISQTAVELDPNSFLSHCGMSMALCGLGMYEEALSAIDAAVTVTRRHPYSLMMLAWIHGVMKNFDAAGKLLEELISRSGNEYISAISLAVAAYHAREFDKAVDYMNQAFIERAGVLPSMSGYPFLSFVKTDPRFQPFFDRLNYPKRI